MNSKIEKGMEATLRQIRAMFDVEYHGDGRIAAVGHKSDGLRKIITILDAALTATGESKTESSPEVTEAMVEAACHRWAKLIKHEYFSDMSSEQQIHWMVAMRKFLAALSVGREGAAQGRDAARTWQARPYEGSVWLTTTTPPTDETRRWLEYRETPALDTPPEGVVEGKIDPGAIRICPMRDGPCPHGMGCEYVGDSHYGYPCKPGWNGRLALSPEGQK